MAKARRTRNAGERFRITATVERFGEKNGSGPPVKMVLLKDVCDASTGITLTDQLWLAAGGWAEHLLASGTSTGRRDSRAFAAARRRRMYSRI